ncbi:transposase [Paraburkholderia hospita]|uniref:transposase n=1 Tax=Paraburkholderia hospita TaxID=169430 RepID=UPI003B75C396
MPSICLNACPSAANTSPPKDAAIIGFSWSVKSPGVCRITASVETGTISRFTGVGNFSSYRRCVDSRRESNSRKKGEGNTKNGNNYLAWAFVEAANFAIRSSPEARRFYERKKRARNSIVGIKALTHKLARARYHMLREHTSPLT